MITTRFKLDTTMLQSNTASHLMAFMLMQRDLLVKAIDVVKLYEKYNELPYSPDINTLSKGEIELVARDFEYILKAHTHALHQRTGTKIYNKKDDDEMYHMKGKEA